MSSPPARHCRRKSLPRREGELRPTDVIGAFFICGLGFLLAAVAVGLAQWLAPWPWGRWLALHLAFVGGVSQLVLGATQFFVGAFLATPILIIARVALVHLYPKLKAELPG